MQRANIGFALCPAGAGKSVSRYLKFRRRVQGPGGSCRGVLGARSHQLSPPIKETEKSVPQKFQTDVLNHLFIGIGSASGSDKIASGHEAVCAGGEDPGLEIAEILFPSSADSNACFRHHKSCSGDGAQAIHGSDSASSFERGSGDGAEEVQRDGIHVQRPDRLKQLDSLFERFSDADDSS